MISNEKMREYVRRLILSRIRILTNHGFYGLLLMHAEFGLDSEIETAATDGEKIIFSPSFMDKLSDSELDFVLMHEIMHIALRHCARTGDRDPFLFNIACDIVVNSNILLSVGGDKSKITIKEFGESMHRTPKGEEGHKYTAEEVYVMVEKKAKKEKGELPGILVEGDGDSEANNSKSGGSKNKKNKKGKSWDCHDKWGKPDSDDSELDALWQKRMKDAATAIEIRQKNTGRGTIPLGVERLLKELSNPQIDWRTILANFVSTDVVDYSFSPPDRRYDDNPFYLPDFNDTDLSVENVLFMIDASASMSDDMITEAYSEIKGAIDQFNGRLKGYLGFFDAKVVPPVPFSDEHSLKIIKPKGGGGTCFDIIFTYVKKNLMQEPPVCIIILTDGYAPFPEEKEALGIPVLWVINNKSVNPPWGKVARIESKSN